MWHSRREGAWSFAHSRIPKSQRFPHLRFCISHTDILLLSHRVRNTVSPFCTSSFHSQGCRRSQTVGRKGACAPDAVPSIRAICCTNSLINHCEMMKFHHAISALPVHRCRHPACYRRAHETHKCGMQRSPLAHSAPCYQTRWSLLA